MSGLPEVDINDWEKNTTYANGYDAECPVIVVGTIRTDTAIQYKYS